LPERSVRIDLPLPLGEGWGEGMSADALLCFSCVGVNTNVEENIYRQASHPLPWPLSQKGEGNKCHTMVSLFEGAV